MILCDKCNKPILTDNTSREELCQCVSDVLYTLSDLEYLKDKIYIGLGIPKKYMEGPAYSTSLKSERFLREKK
jgi:hypothetical protein